MKTNEVSMAAPMTPNILFGVRRPSRSAVICGVVGLLTVAGLLYAVVGGLIDGRKVALGREWTALERVSIDDIDHRAWDDLLQRYVDEAGDVDYSAWKETTTDVHALDAYLDQLSRAEPDVEASRAARLSYWINAYNALTVRGILREYPTTSIQNHAARLWGYNIWRDVLLRVGNKKYSLGQIEHESLRPMHEPRIHFAIVCASRGCPRLLNHAYEPRNLERQLDENSRAFFADPEKLQYDPATAQLYLSPILKWYAGDFGQTQSERLKTIAPYLPEGVSDRLSGAGLRVTYLDYDWSLNDQAGDPSTPPLPPDLAPAEFDAPVARTSDFP